MGLAVEGDTLAATTPETEASEDNNEGRRSLVIDQVGLEQPQREQVDAIVQHYRVEM
ncbi:MAG: hypothetical protein GWO24_13835, partial [Akkermansiaceae bacterium]|nr:hypothetical protein [Akkermansiaceae bacterium]